MNKVAVIRFTRILIVMLAISAGVYCWLYLKRPDVLPIRTVQVEGQLLHIQRADLQAAAVPYVNTGFFAFSPHELKDHLLSIPWVADVSITRVWPDTISVSVTEKQAVARWGKKGVVTRDGDIFYPPVKTISAQLPLFLGQAAQARAMTEQYEKMQQELKTLGLSIIAVECSPRHAWTVKLNNEITLELGRSDLDERLERFTRSYHKIIGSHGTAVDKVDLRYSNGLAVRWKQV